MTSKDEFILEHDDQMLVLPVTISKQEIKQLFSISDFYGLELDDGSLIIDFSTDSSSSMLRALRLCDTSAKIILAPKVVHNDTASRVPEKKRTREENNNLQLEEPKRVKSNNSLKDGNVTPAATNEQRLSTNACSISATINAKHSGVSSVDVAQTAVSFPVHSYGSDFELWFAQRPEQLREGDYLQFWEYFFDKLSDCSSELRCNAVERMLQILQNWPKDEPKSTPTNQMFGESSQHASSNLMLHNSSAMSQQQ